MNEGLNILNFPREILDEILQWAFWDHTTYRFTISSSPSLACKKFYTMLGPHLNKHKVEKTTSTNILIFGCTLKHYYVYGHLSYEESFKSMDMSKEPLCIDLQYNTDIGILKVCRYSSLYNILIAYYYLSPDNNYVPIRIHIISGRKILIHYTFVGNLINPCDKFIVTDSVALKCILPFASMSAADTYVYVNREKPMSDFIELFVYLANLYRANILDRVYKHGLKI